MPITLITANRCPDEGCKEYYEVEDIQIDFDDAETSAVGVSEFFVWFKCHACGAKYTAYIDSERIVEAIIKAKVQLAARKENE